jgi:phosphate transport system permease protein
MGETAPLILIGMVGFFPKMATSFFDESTVMPAQIFQWWSLPHRAFQSRAALAILLLLAVLFVMNGLAVVLRAKTQETGS